MREWSSLACSVFPSVTSLVTVVKVLEDGEEGFDTLPKTMLNKDFKDFNFNALSASTTRHRHSDFIYN